MRAAVALVLAVALGACAFWSDKPLFGAEDAAAPIADGAQFRWIEDGGGGEQIVTYRRVGPEYELAEFGSDDPPMAVLFVEVSQTPEEDYIVQVATRADESGRFYAFMWRIEQGYRVVAAPRAFQDHAPGEAALARHCADRPGGECRFDAAEAVVAFYREAIYPAFVVTNEPPNDYIDQVAVAEASAGK